MLGEHCNKKISVFYILCNISPSSNKAIFAIILTRGGVVATPFLAFPNRALYKLGLGINRPKFIAK